MEKFEKIKKDLGEEYQKKAQEIYEKYRMDHPPTTLIGGRCMKMVCGAPPHEH